MDLHADPPAIVEVIQAPSEHQFVLGDLSCETFILHVAQLGAESNALIVVIKVDAKRTHPAA